MPGVSQTRQRGPIAGVDLRVWYRQLERKVNRDRSSPAALSRGSGQYRDCIRKRPARFRAGRSCSFSIATFLVAFLPMPMPSAGEVFVAVPRVRISTGGEAWIVGPASRCCSAGYCRRGAAGTHRVARWSDWHRRVGSGTRSVAPGPRSRCPSAAFQCGNDCSASLASGLDSLGFSGAPTTGFAKTALDGRKNSRNTAENTRNCGSETRKHNI